MQWRRRDEETETMDSQDGPKEDGFDYLAYGIYGMVGTLAVTLAAFVGYKVGKVGARKPESTSLSWSGELQETPQKKHGHRKSITPRTAEAIKMVDGGE